ncbi:MAG: hypothetical protein ACYDBB_25720 [Armatimonadota bacterium]
MNTRRIDQFEKELHDPALTSLLRDAFDGDPALAESHGRSERIMRKVLASGIRPARPAVRWAPLAWAFGASAAAAGLVLALVLGLLQSPRGPGNLVDNHVAPQQRQEQQVNPKQLADRHLPVPEERQHDGWQNPAPEGSVVQNPDDILPKHPDDDTQENKPTEENPVRVAEALYAAGDAANAVGDYETAFEAYQASYEAMPTPDAILSSAKMLEHLADAPGGTEG